MGHLARCRLGPPESSWLRQGLKLAPLPGPPRCQEMQRLGSKWAAAVQQQAAAQSARRPGPATDPACWACLCSADKMKSFGGDTPYSIMFGPDICGYSTRKVGRRLCKQLSCCLGSMYCLASCKGLDVRGGRCVSMCVRIWHVRVVRGQAGRCRLSALLPQLG